MTTIRLRPSSIFVTGSASVVGGDSAWADDDLATYVSLSGSGDTARGEFDLAPEVDGAASVTMGMVYTLTSLASLKSFGLNFGSIAGHINPPSVFGSSTPPLATQGTFTYLFGPDDYAAEGTSLAGVVARFVSGPQGTDANVPSIDFGGFVGLTVFEAWVDFEMPDVVEEILFQPWRRQLGRNALSQFHNRTHQQGLRQFGIL